ncbi:hypothetical protein [Pseudosulfitobacter koreensis]|uniref:Lipoprotein n=1 Tax=Pseudosulfitobacter koreensis TaxID=2968472 RepID=A0ABT1Z4F3_9RHOB|nr:hypothetical protein [Pseudosulfitobacter koreense]MCR8828018.1 hypothetical protein [Pseudosulfitobacter koreense]
MTFIKRTAALVALSLIAACSTGTTQTPAATKVTTLTPAYMAQNGFRQLSYTGGGKSYVLYTKRDALARGDKVLIQVTKGTPFTRTTADDVEVQNTVRDAYRALGLCPAGQHPGLISFGYGASPSVEPPTWSAYVRCSDKMQANVT